jgi:hypothetical protein
MSKHIFKVNVELVKRMYQDHNYSIQDICLRLRYSPESILAVIERYKLNNEHSQRNNKSSN